MGTAMEAMHGSSKQPVEAHKKNLLDGQQSCSVEFCDAAALISLGQKPLCLNHFIVRCYEWLDYLDPLIRGRIYVQREMERVQALVEECSNRTLLVSLRCEDLTNLDRSRLLDILLLSSDLLFQLRVPRNEFPTLFAHQAKSRSKSQYEAPGTKSASSLG
jgi:hypothetical protein